jgi:3'-phosphoadenosine 5'-phosphosulfate sulfotransferase (PAPS reductase)/FAD synthetase
MTIKCVVPVSGGKDSQACLQLALERFDKSEVIGLFCDTKFEHPTTYDHVRWMEYHYGVEVVNRNSGSVVEQVKKWGRFPGGGARFCTEYLKIETSKHFYKELADKQGGFEVWYGMRSGESHERATRYKGKLNGNLYAPNEIMKKYPKYLGAMGVTFRLPILDWTENDVFDLLDGKENPLYDAGFERVGCFPCLAAGDRHKELAFSFDEFGRKQFEIVRQLEKEIGKSVFTSKGGCQRNNEDQLCLICTI